jgi:D-alanyl-lipoteichoic acid acyltransferase DltB (MBOAT superfamily)
MLSKRQQNYMLLLASYIFYASWNWRFLALIMISTVVAYVAGLGIAGTNDQRTKRKYLFISAFVNLAILAFFKYFNFFSESFLSLLNALGLENISIHHSLELAVILPVGISFYTFQTMSYAIDVYRGEIKPTRNFADLALFVSFFPQLVAGPIERAKNLLPQVLGYRKANAEKNREGVWLILWGLFKKVVIADNIASIVNTAFNNSVNLTAPEVIIAAYAFAVQIYCDFSGYSDIARGTAKLLGFDIMVNFRLPFLAQNPSDYWRRWHISLSTWLRDYLYIPLGGNRGSNLLKYRNLMVTMVLGGLWHGAAWTFVIWGFYHGTLLVLHHLLRPMLEKWVRNSGAWKALKVVVTFQLMAIGWLIFRAENFGQLREMLLSLISCWSGTGITLSMATSLITYSWPLLVVQLCQQNQGSLLPQYNWPHTLRVAFYSLLVYMIFTYGVMSGQEFIYFQF